jgi:YegS/Rv2252/BmrU family lipid kinase
LEAGHRRFLALGGDGTVFEMVNGLCTHPRVPPEASLVTQLPVGTGCDWARAHDLPRTAQAILPLLQEPAVRQQDLGQVHFRAGGQPRTRYFVNAAGLGFDAYVLQQAADQPKGGWRGKLFYLSALLRSLRSYRPQELAVQQAGKDLRQGPCLLLMVGLGPYAGGGMQLCPDARLDDGAFDLTYIEGISAVTVVRNLPLLYNGNLYRHPQVHHGRGPCFSVQADPTTWLELDGECVGHAPAEFAILPQALRVGVERGE